MKPHHQHDCLLNNQEGTHLTGYVVTHEKFQSKCIGEGFLSLHMMRNY